jgi:hypothetical protein
MENARCWLLVLISAVALVPSRASAQTPPTLAGSYVACFRGADTTRLACGTLTLSAKTVCGNSTLDGYYSILFSALLGAKTASHPTRPGNEAHFTWEQSPDGKVKFTRTAFVSDSLLGGDTRCDESPGSSDFEAWGHTTDDSIAGSWGWYDHYSGMVTLGTFILRRMR